MVLSVMDNRQSGAEPSDIEIGLALAKSIAEGHEGYIRAENVPSGGVKFSLYLPH
jgi:signal transduction histidine kinase